MCPIHLYLPGYDIYVYPDVILIEITQTNKHLIELSPPWSSHSDESKSRSIICVCLFVYVWFLCTVLYNEHELLWSIKRLLTYHEQLTCVLHGLDNYYYTPKLWIVYCLCWIIYEYISLTVFTEIKVMIMKLKFSLFCCDLELSPLQSYAGTVEKSFHLPNYWICLKYQDVD